MAYKYYGDITVKDRLIGHKGRIFVSQFKVLREGEALARQRERQ